MLNTTKKAKVFAILDKLVYNLIMSLRTCVFGSGSKGNCIYVGSQKTNMIIDVGLPATKIEKCLKVLGVNLDTVSVLITHEHSDHIKSLDKLISKYNLTVYASVKSYAGISASCDVSKGNFVWFEDGDFFVGDVAVSAFEVSHDVPCVGYRFSCYGKKMAVITDIGKITQSSLRCLTGCDLVVLESNHDCQMLNCNKKYPPYLKKRILSGKGHLSNSDCADCICTLVPQGTKQVILAHLSEENNCPELAFETVKDKLAENGYVEGKDVRVEVAYQDKISALFEIN